VADLADTSTVGGRPHGYARYRLDGCRCYVCGWARAQYEDNRQKQIRLGTWVPFVDAGPVREHLATLSAAGMGTRRIAELAGVDRKRILALTNGTRGRAPSSKVRPATAAAILAVRPCNAAIAPKTVVDGTGTARRIQALCCIGWSLTAQAKRIGWTVQNYSTLTAGRPVTASTARLITGLYDDLSMTPTPAGQASRTLRLAGLKRWFPPLAWDDDAIDDPNACPVLLAPVGAPLDAVDEMAIQHLAAGHKVATHAALRDEVVLRMTVAGSSVSDIAQTLGVSGSTVRTRSARMSLTGRRAEAAA
jgi:hypothetical protein